MRSEPAAYAAALKQVETQATWESSRYEVINHHGQLVPLEVVAEDFRQIRIEAVVGVRQPDVLFDEFRLPLVAEFRSRTGTTVITHQALELTLRPGANPIQLNLRLQPHQFARATSDCILELRLGNRVLAPVPVTHKTRRQINQGKTARQLESLSLADVELAVEREGECLVTDAVFATDRRVISRFTAHAEGFDEDVPRLQWQLIIQLCHVASRRTFEQTHTLRIRAGSNRCRRLAVPLEHLRACFPPGRCTLSLLCRDRLLAQREFRFLAEDEIVPYTQQLVLANLRVLDPQLVCESRNHAYATQTVPFCAERLRVRLTLQSQGFTAALSEWTLPLRLNLPGARLAATPVCQTPVTLSSRPSTLDVPFSLADSALADQPGAYEIEVHLEGREIARIPFRIVSEAEIIQHIEVTSCEMVAVPRHGGAPVRCDQLSLEEHRELRIAFGVRAGFPAPGFTMPGRVEVMAGQRVLYSSDFLSPLDQETIRRELKPLSLAALWATDGVRDQSLHVQISVGGAIKCCHPLRLQIRARLTNFEGALKQDAHALGNVDEEYRAILQALER